MLGAGGGWGSGGGLSKSLLIVLPEYQKAPPVWGRVTLCFFINKVAFFPEEDGGADGVVSRGNFVTLVDINADTSAWFPHLVFLNLTKVLDDPAFEGLGVS